MTVTQVDKLLSRKPDKDDTYNGMQVYHYEVTEVFRIHVVIEAGYYKIIRLDLRHKVHNVLILDIIRLNEKYKEKENVFEQFNSERLPDLKRITRDDLSPILSLDLGSLPLPIRARIADFLWVTIKDPNSGQIAISSYLDLYDSLWDEEQWPNCIDAIYRAINISCGLGKKGKTIKTA